MPDPVAEGGEAELSLDTSPAHTYTHPRAPPPQPARRDPPAWTRPAQQTADRPRPLRPARSPGPWWPGTAPWSASWRSRCSSASPPSCAGSRGPRPCPRPSRGGSVNPARQFGPAIVSGQLDFLWVYLLAPMVGAVAATSLRNRFLKRRAVRTYRLCGTDCAGSPPARPVDRVEAFEGTGLLMLALHRSPGRLRPRIGPVVHVAVRRLSRRWTPRPPCRPRPPR
ncbi:aquaporin [Streptomyces sp. 11-1-2]|uniref:aquaporin n=1 Tax=unclassified Streptomyces TaxID=2593676 RepID=UPI001F09D40D|nr:aquaporin [Streptomyces sp. 11-1-2]